MSSRGRGRGLSGMTQLADHLGIQRKDFRSFASDVPPPVLYPVRFMGTVYCDYQPKNERKISSVLPKMNFSKNSSLFKEELTVG